ncbi:MAG: SDR family oxidoreductase [Candidatus Marinimicrobia bacterium]|nr:SDR family oxidoreductase [Candidatus Neomarinimicrobiota bacterium]
MIEKKEKRITLVTGATSGIGYATADGLLKEGHTVLLLGRSEDRLLLAYRSLMVLHPEANIKTVLCDLSSQESIRNASTILLKDLDRIDVLINNAGSFASKRKETKNGFEWQLGINHLGHFYLTHLLLPLIKNSKQGRIINMSSGSHYKGRMHWNDLQLKHYRSLKSYGQSKLANVLFTYELARRLKNINITVNAVDPGLVNTNMGEKDTGFLTRFIWSRRKKTGESVKVGASSSVYLASSEEGGTKSGLYWKYCKPIHSSKRSYNIDDQLRLWEISTILCEI